MLSNIGSNSDLSKEPASIATYSSTRKMEAVRSSETWMNRNFLHIQCCENPKNQTKPVSLLKQDRGPLVVHLCNSRQVVHARDLS
jgi:hypothetical protein